jgi:hypothetical protein
VGRLLPLAEPLDLLLGLSDRYLELCDATLVEDAKQAPVTAVEFGQVAAVHALRLCEIGGDLLALATCLSDQVTDL